MAEVVNLRRARKARDRAAAEASAATNRALHGRSLAQRARDEGDADRQERRLDGARLESPPREG